MSEIIAYDRDYRVYITRPQSPPRDIFYDNRGVVRNLGDEIRDITLEGLGVASFRNQAIVPFVSSGSDSLIEKPVLSVNDFDFSTTLIGSSVKQTIQTVTDTTEQTLLFTPPLHMEADVKYETANSNGGNGSCSIKLYNLNKESIAEIKKGYIVTLFAGYKSLGDLFLCFVGKIDSVVTNFDGSGSVVTEIKCKETSGIKTNSTVQACYKLAAGSSIGELFERFIDTFKLLGYPEGDFQRNKATQIKLLEATVINAPLSEALTKVCEAVNYTWMISLGKLYILPRYAPRPVQFISVTPETIITIDSGEDSDSPTPASGTDIEKASGIKLTTFFTPHIRPENFLQVSGVDNHAGLYKPIKLSYSLSWHGGDWVTITQCERIEDFGTERTNKFDIALYQKI